MTPTLPDIPAVETQIVEMTNSFRAQNKLQNVKSNAVLTAIARAYATYLAKNGKFSHTADGREASERVSAGGYEWCETGENLASFLDSRGFTSLDLAKSSVEGWINSPGHRKNMLAEFVTETGVGVARAPGDKPKFIAVQLFARPKALEYKFQVSNASSLTVTYSFGGETQSIEPHFATTHTACLPSALTFDSAAGKGSAAKTLSGRYQATDGVVYVLKPDKTLGVKIEIEKFQKVK
jgi:Cysteine-rich secretory protein family